MFKNNRQLSLVFLLLHAENAAIIVFLSRLTFQATELVCSHFDARIFLEKLQYVPQAPRKAAIAATILFFIYILMEFLHKRVISKVPQKKIETTGFCTFFIYLIICVALMHTLNMNYKGILFLPAVHAVTNIHNRPFKTISLSVVFIMYIFLDHDFVSSVIKVVPFDTYISYYPKTEQIRLLAIKTLLFSINDVLFLSLIMMYIRLQATEHNRIQELNKKLNSSLRSLKAANAQLTEYAKKSEDMAKLKERNRLAREIHDTIGHVLTGIEIGLKACLCIPRENIGELFTQLEKVEQLAQKGSQDVRFSLKELRPDALQRYSLASALESLVRQMNECTNTHSFLTFEDEIPKITASQEELVYRIVQESMTNSISHGEASEVEIRIGNDGKNLYISICDNGIGAKNYIEGFGLTNIKERVEYFKGKVEIKTALNKGFELHIVLPLMRSPSYD